MILVDVYVNSIDKHFDMFIEKNILVPNLVKEIVKVVLTVEKKDLSGAIDDMLLCNIDNGTIMRGNRTIFEYGVVNGTKLLVV